VNRRVLIIGHPFVGFSMAGVRLRRLAKWLPRHGWEPVVLSVPRDANASWKLPAGARLEEIEAPDLAHFYQKLRRRRPALVAAATTGPKQPVAKEIGFTSWLNRWVMIPDKQLPWHRPAVRRGRELLRAEKYDAIFASIEPRTSSLVGAQLARETGVPLVTEYRDLWTGNPYYHISQPTALHRWIHVRLERKALRQAKRVSAVCRGIAQYLTKAQGDVLPGEVALNYNFFDADEYPAPGAAPAKRPLTISYTGAMYFGRTPHQFFEGMRAFVDRAKLSPGQFRFTWAGSIAGIPDLPALLDRTGVRPYMDFLGQVPHTEALRQMMQSDAALLIQAPNDDIHIPGKLFEALGAGVPLLALANPCEVTDIIVRCRAGIVSAYSTESIVGALEQLHQRHQQGLRWEMAADEVRRFSADAAVAKLASLFEEVSSPARS
jgi:glycosyltransferase involved in cell wall biosynthesis